MLGWDGRPTEILGRAVDETGYTQPEMSALQRVRGRRTRYHLNPVTGWTMLDFAVKVSTEASKGL